MDNFIFVRKASQEQTQSSFQASRVHRGFKEWTVSPTSTSVEYKITERHDLNIFTGPLVFQSQFSLAVLQWLSPCCSMIFEVANDKVGDTLARCAKCCDSWEGISQSSLLYVFRQPPGLSNPSGSLMEWVAEKTAWFMGAELESIFVAGEIASEIESRRRSLGL